MYRGFSLTTDTIYTILHELKNKDYYRGVCKRSMDYQKLKVRKELENFIIIQGRVDVSTLRDEWFPTDEYDVFLSHSHGDLGDMEALAGYLIKEKGLKVFIDSHIWGYYDDLLRELNNKYNLISDNTYSYLGANLCCSNVTTILNAALQETIDKSEAIFFYNTPNSITHNYNGSDRTGSNWIFNEIETTRIIRKRKPKRKSILIEKSAGAESIKNNIEFSYEVKHKHLKKITSNSFNRWIVYKSEKEKLALDELYQIVGG